MENITARICKDCGGTYTDEKKSTMCPTCRTKKGKRSRRKGNSNELRFAKKLQALFDKYELNYKVGRTPRSGAIHALEPADILFTKLPNESVFNRHWELKNTVQWTIEDWFKKAEDIEIDRESNRPVTLNIRKPNASKSYIVIDEDDYLKTLIELELLKNE